MMDDFISLMNTKKGNNSNAPGIRKRLNFNAMPAKEMVALLKQEEEKGKFRVVGAKNAKQRLHKYYWLQMPRRFRRKNNKKPIILKSTGQVLSDSYTRIVIGDHGAYIEFDDAKPILHLKKGQEWRIKGTNPYAKYVWWVSIKGDKVYQQLGTVKYADYKVGKYYISPYLVK
jgi:hypothetical protein